MGGKNPFMGIAYVVVGGICIVLGALFTVAHLVKPRYVADHPYSSHPCFLHCLCAFFDCILISR